MGIANGNGTCMYVFMHPIYLSCMWVPSDTMRVFCLLGRLGGMGVT